MPKGYVIVTEEIHDPTGMAKYSALAGPTLADFGAKAIVVDQHAEILEGEWHGNQTVILEFESVEKAHEWYDSPRYREACAVRQAAATSNAVILSGLAPRG